MTRETKDMKIAVTSTGPTLDDTVETRFGRCAYFLTVLDMRDGRTKAKDYVGIQPAENPYMAGVRRRGRSPSRTPPAEDGPRELGRVSVHYGVAERGTVSARFRKPLPGDAGRLNLNIWLHQSLVSSLIR